MPIIWKSFFVCFGLERENRFNAVKNSDSKMKRNSKIDWRRIRIMLYVVGKYRWVLFFPISIGKIPCLKMKCNSYFFIWWKTFFSWKVDDDAFNYKKIEKYVCYLNKWCKSVKNCTRIRHWIRIWNLLLHTL